MNRKTALYALILLATASSQLTISAPKKVFEGIQQKPSNNTAAAINKKNLGQTKWSTETVHKRAKKLSLGAFDISLGIAAIYACLTLTSENTTKPLGPIFRYMHEKIPHSHHSAWDSENKFQIRSLKQVTMIATEIFASTILLKYSLNHIRGGAMKIKSSFTIRPPEK